MWYPVSLTINNLFSYEQSSFEFKNNQITTIYGINKTDLNVLSNGSGKTSILDCISIGLLGEPLRDISKKEIVRNGEKFGQCVLILKNDVLNKELQIFREIHSTKSSDCQIYENDVLNTSLKDLEVKETDKYILKLLGISKEDIKNYFLISKDSYQSFFLNGDTAKKEIINRFSKANIIDNIDPLIKEDTALLDLTINNLKTQHTSNLGILNHLDEELNKEKLDSSIEQTRQATIKSLEERKSGFLSSLNSLPEFIENKKNDISAKLDYVNSISNNISSLEKELEVEGNKKESIELSLNKLDDEREIIDREYEPKIKEVDEKISNCEFTIQKHNDSSKEYNSEIIEIDKILAGEIGCPKCEHRFILNNKEYNIKSAIIEREKLISLGEDIKTYINTEQNFIIELKSTKQSVYNEIQKKLELVNKRKDAVREEINSVNSYIKQLKLDINKQSNDLLQHNSQLNLSKNELSVLESKSSLYVTQINDCDLSIEKEKAKIYPDKTAEIKEKIASLKESNESLQVEINEWEETKGSLLEWQSRFKQFKSFLANTSISAIEEMTNYFLQKMKTNLSVVIEGYRELSNKKLKEEITCLVCRDGLNGESFSKFSGGEKAKIDLAAILSMQKIINLTTENGGLNLLFIDEILESVDEVGLSGIIKSLSELETTIMIITHVAPDKTFECNRIEVIKEKGISCLN